MLGLVLLVSSGCVHRRDFSEPSQRILEDTAYTLQRNEGSVGVGLVGKRTEDLGVSLRASFAPSRYLQLSTNLAHDIFSAANLELASNFLDREHVALGARVGFWGISPRRMWFLPEEQRERFGEIGLIRLPIAFQTSFPVVHWFSVHGALEYVHTELQGFVDEEAILVDGALGARTLRINPGFHFYAGRRVAFVVSGRVPLYSVGYEEVVVETELKPGTVAGVKSAEWRRIPNRIGTSASAGVEVRLGKYTNIQLYVVYAGFLRALGVPAVLPGLSMYWRFGGPGWKDRKERSP